MLRQWKYSLFLGCRQGKTYHILCILFIAFPLNILSAFDHNGRGIKAIGMANAFVAVADNPWAIDYNPAGITSIENIQCTAFVVPGQFGMKELTTNAFAAAMPLSGAALAIKFEKFGYELYKEMEIGAAAAFTLDSSIAGGFGIRVDRLDIARYGNTQTIICDAGILAAIMNTLKMGFQIRNLTGAALGKTKEKESQIFSFGMCWSPFSDFLLSAEIEKDVRFPESLKWGLAHGLGSGISIYLGTANNPAQYSAGIAIDYHGVEFGYAGYRHYCLGWTHQVELSFQIKK